MSDWTETKKLELHLHLEGAAQPDFIRKLAAEKSVDLSSIFDADGHYDYPDFLGFLKVYDRACTVLQGPDDFRRLVEAVLENQASHGVIYTEHFVSPDFCGGGDQAAWNDYFAAMSEGAANAEAKHGILGRFILTSVRHLGAEQAKVTAKVAANTDSAYLVGYGMGGDENHLLAADFAPAFDIARAAGLRLTSHAGEMAGPDSVRDTLDHLRVERLGHGVRAVEDPDLIRRIAEEGIVLEVNPGSNITLGVFPSWPDHPIDSLIDAGVKVTVSTDDPPFFHTDMTHEYTMLNQTFGWGAAEFSTINRTAVEAAFCDEPTKAKIIEKLGELPCETT